MQEEFLILVDKNGKEWKKMDEQRSNTKLKCTSNNLQNG